MQQVPHGRSIAPWAVAVLGIVASVAAWRTLVLAEDRAVGSHIAAEADRHTATVRHTMSDALLVVESFGALFRYSPEEIPDEFPKMARDLILRQPGLRALSWNPRVPHARRKVFEAAIGTGITEWGEGSVPAASVRSHYDVVHSIVPLDGNEAAIGLDVRTEPRRRAALERAATSGEISITSVITLVQGDQRTTGFLAFQPQYTRLAEKQGEANLRGFIVGVFDVAGIFAGFVRADGFPASFALFDLDGEQPEQVHAVSVREAEPVPANWKSTGWNPFRASIASFAIERRFDIGGRPWALRLEPDALAIASQRTPMPGRVLLLGLLATGVSTLLLLSLTGRNRAIHRLVDQRTGELEEARSWLEERVALRTADLARINRELGSEIAQRESAESALRASEERLRLTLDTVSDGGWDWTFPDQRLVLSDSWYRSVGRKPGSIDGYENLATELIHPDDLASWRKSLRSHLKGETPLYECSLRMKTGSGEWRWFQDRAAVVSWDEKGRPLRMVGIHTDVTDQRRLEDERLRLAEKVQQTQRLESLGVLAGGIAHDFNNLLAGILGNADLALLKIGPETTCSDELEEVKLAARRAAELTRQLLAYAGKARFALEPIDLSRLVGEMTRLLNASISKGAELHSELAGGLPAIEGDPGQIQQVVMNLITNASDAIGEGPGIIAVRTGTEPASEGEAGAAVSDGSCSVFVEVVDDGCGMDDATCERIFDPFFTTKFQGRGLGLAAALGIVRAHQGTIEIETRKGLGTTFRVVFPCAAGCREVAAPDAQQSAVSGAGTVLVVDDEPTVLSFAGRSLAHAGFTTRSAGSGPEAIRIFEEEADGIDAVLLDLTMPVLTGREVMLALRKIRPGVRILASSGYAEEDSIDEFGSERPDGFLQKPYLARQLIEALTKLLA